MQNVLVGNLNLDYLLENINKNSKNILLNNNIIKIIKK